MQLDETADPIILAWQLGGTGRATWPHVRKAADFLLGYVDRRPAWRRRSRAGALGEPERLLPRDDRLADRRARVRGGHRSRQRRHRVGRPLPREGGRWRAQVKSLTATTRARRASPTSCASRRTETRTPARRTASVTAARASTSVRSSTRRSSSSCGSACCAPTTRTSQLARRRGRPARCHDAERRVLAPLQRRWLWREKDGSQWDTGFPGPQTTIGRAWPIFAGERGEYELRPAAPPPRDANAMAKSGNDGRMLPEQVWDPHPPSGTAGFPAGEGTFSATPLVWTHAQFVRLAQSIRGRARWRRRTSSRAATWAADLAATADLSMCRDSRKPGVPAQREP